MHARTVARFVTCIAAGGLLLAQTQQPAASRKVAATTAKRSASSLSFDDVLSMLEVRVPEHIIVKKVKKNAKAFDLSPSQLVTLKKASASDDLIEVLMDPDHPYSPPGAAAAAPPPPAPKEPEPLAPPPPSVAKPAPAPRTQTLDVGVGVYLKKGGEWIGVQPEIVSWKTAGTIKSIASVGVVRRDLNGNIDGPSSKNSVVTPLEVLIVTPEGVAIAEYQLIRLRVNDDNNYREFRSVTGGILNHRSGAMRDLVPFESKKIASRSFLVIVPASIGRGEYGFLPPGAGGSSTTASVSSAYGKMYTFRIVE
jgi:hypothetical protein